MAVAVRKVWIVVTVLLTSFDIIRSFHLPNPRSQCARKNGSNGGRNKDPSVFDSYSVDKRGNVFSKNLWSQNSSTNDSAISDESVDITDPDKEKETTKFILAGGIAVLFGATIALLITLGNDLGLPGIPQFIKDPSNSFDVVVQSLDGMDKQRAAIYFSLFYLLAEILAIPAFPLTAASGYLFGAASGTALCLFIAAIAASISFVIGKTLLRGFVEGILDDNPKFRSLDRAIEKEGFKLMILLRLSPLFPFALSNYLYGATSIRFSPFFFGTFLGFAPGTFAYVYGGVIGKALTVGEGMTQPWYVYAGGMVFLLGLIKTIGDVATGIIDEMEAEEDA